MDAPISLRASTSGASGRCRRLSLPVRRQRTPGVAAYSAASSLSAVPEAPRSMESACPDISSARRSTSMSWHSASRDASARAPAPPAMKSITSRRALSLLLSGSSATASRMPSGGNMRRSNLNSMMYNLNSVQAVRLRLRSL